MSLVIAVLYVDAFVLKGAPFIVERAELLPLRGFSAPYVLLRCYGVVLAAPYLAIAYMLLRATGFLGEASRKTQKQTKTRISLLYDRYFGYEGSLFVWKVFVFHARHDKSASGPHLQHVHLCEQHSSARSRIRRSGRKWRRHLRRNMVTLLERRLE